MADLNIKHQQLCVSKSTKKTFLPKKHVPHVLKNNIPIAKGGTT